MGGASVATVTARSLFTCHSQNPEFGTSDAVSEAELSLHLIQEEIRQIEVTTTKANARLDSLKDSGSKKERGRERERR